MKYEEIPIPIEDNNWEDQGPVEEYKIVEQGEVAPAEEYAEAELVPKEAVENDDSPEETADRLKAIKVKLGARTFSLTRGREFGRLTSEELGERIRSFHKKAGRRLQELSKAA